MKSLFERLLGTTNLLFIIGLCVFFYFNFIGTGFRGFFDLPVSRAEEKTYWVVLILLSIFTLLTGLFGREASAGQIQNKSLVIYSKVFYLWTTLLFTGLFVIATLFIALYGNTEFIITSTLFSGVSAAWACYLYKVIPAIEDHSSEQVNHNDIPVSIKLKFLAVFLLPIAACLLIYLLSAYIEDKNHNIPAEVYFEEARTSQDADTLGSSLLTCLEGMRGIYSHEANLHYMLVYFLFGIAVFSAYCTFSIFRYCQTRPADNRA